MDRYPLDFMHERVLRTWRSYRLDCLDLRAAYWGFDDIRELWANPFDAHPGEVAHRLAAEAILEKFEPTWIDSSQ